MVNDICIYIYCTEVGGMWNSICFTLGLLDFLIVVVSHFLLQDDSKFMLYLSVTQI